MYNKLWKRNIHDSCNVKQMHNIQRTYNISYNKLWKRNIHDSCNVKQMHNIQRTYNICTTNYGNEIYTIHVMLNKCITYNAPTICCTTRCVVCYAFVLTYTRIVYISLNIGCMYIQRTYNMLCICLTLHESCIFRFHRLLYVAAALGTWFCLQLVSLTVINV